MAQFFFLHTNVFNVIKYLVLSLTISCVADDLIHIVYAYRTSRKLLGAGRVRPADSFLRFRHKRDITNFRKSFGGISVFATVLAVLSLEMALEFSTGAESVWTERTETFRMSNHLSNASEFIQHSPVYMTKMRLPLERVEDVCYSIRNSWYSPTIFNFTNVPGERKGVWCLQNRTTHIDATEDLERSSFRAADVVEMNIWNPDELSVGRDEIDAEVYVPFSEAPDSRIGVREHYSHLAVNFSRKNVIEESKVRLTANNTFRNPMAIFTVNYRVSNDNVIECLCKVVWKPDKTTGLRTQRPPWVEACLVPISEEDAVLARNSPRANGDGHQLVMSVALQGVSTFRDLNVLRALPWMVGKNDGIHTYRELGALALLSQKMIQGISGDGYRDLQLSYGVESITVPTWDLWGVVLFGVGLILMAGIRIAMSRLRRRLKVKGNLATARGVATHWLWQEEDFKDINDAKGEVVLVTDSLMSDGWTRVKVSR
ncbi:hypothetical protein FGB62_305g02 [Gracilaria domingensis]|nr:hypothetical protein FGB62_305g02 [Gracilaria domingensis]